MEKLQVSAWSDLFYELNPEQIVEQFKKCGFNVMELAIGTGEELLKRSSNVTKTGREFKRHMNNLDFSTPQGHLKLDCDICEENPSKLIDELKNWITLYQEAGVKNMVLHSGGYDHSLTKEELFDRRASAICQLLPLFDGTDCFLCLENLVTIIPSSTELVETIEGIGHRNLGVCFDVGHLNLTETYSKKEEPEHFVATCGKYIKALHLTDNDGRTDQHLIPNVCLINEEERHDKTKIDMYKLTRLLKSVGYDGLFNFEVVGEMYAPLEIKVKKLELMKLVGEFYLDRCW